MKFILSFFLLTGLQALCHDLPGHHEEPEQSGDKNPLEPQHQPPAEGQRTETTGFRKIVIPNAEYAFRLHKLLTGLQALCHDLPGHHEEQEQSGDKNPLEAQHQPPAEGQGTKITGFRKIVIPNAEYAFRLHKLLTGLQALCHDLPGQHEEQQQSGDKNPLEAQHQPPAEGQGTETTGFRKIVIPNAEYAFRLHKLLTGLQALCHDLPGHHEEQEQSGDKNPLEAQHQPPAEGQGTEPKHFKKIVKSNAKFAFRLYKLIASDPSPQNVNFSPLGISAVFGMVMLGAKNETHRQLANGLEWNSSGAKVNDIHAGFHEIIHKLNKRNNVSQMNFGIVMFVNELLKMDLKFLKNATTMYEADYDPISLSNSTAAENKINDYIKNKTNGKIPQAIQGLDGSTEMVLLNYVFFKAHWKDAFHHVWTRKTNFFVNATTTVKVNMMYRRGVYDFLHDEDLSCWVVRVPYHEDYAAWFILPDQGKMKAVEDALSIDLFMKWFESFKTDEIRLYIPKFSISGSYDVKDLMQKLGVKDVFSDDADLSGITGEPNVKVSKAVHKAMMDVHEGVTEAAADTAIESEFDSAQFPSPTIECNRPFMMFSGHQQLQHLTFMARVNNPTAN